MQSTASMSGFPVSRAMRVESSRSSARIFAATARSRPAFSTPGTRHQAGWARARVSALFGIDAEVSDFATRESAAYGAIAVLTAVVAGWLASLPFRGV